MEAHLSHPQTALVGSCFCTFRWCQLPVFPAQAQATLSSVKAGLGRSQLNGLKHSFASVVFYIPVNVLWIDSCAALQSRCCQRLIWGWGEKGSVGNIFWLVWPSCKTVFARNGLPHFQKSALTALCLDLFLGTFGISEKCTEREDKVPFDLHPLPLPKDRQDTQAIETA